MSEIMDVLLRTGLQAKAMTREWLTNPLKAVDIYVRERDVELGVSQTFEPNSDNWDSVLRAFWIEGFVCGRWAMSGFPTVRMGHKTAALLMATSIKPEHVEELVRIPWPGFIIELPKPLLWIGVGQDKMEEASVVLVGSLDGRWWYQVLGSNPSIGHHGHRQFLGIWQFNLESGHMAGAPLVDKNGVTYREWQLYEKSPIDAVTHELVKNLIIGTCLHLSGDPRHRALADSTTVKERKPNPKHKGSGATIHEYELQSSIKIDLTRLLGDIRSYARGEVVRRESASRVLVSGHWRRFAVGQGRTERRLQHVAPFWRGAEDAPLSVRIK